MIRLSYLLKLQLAMTSMIKDEKMVLKKHI